VSIILVIFWRQQIS